MDLNLLYVFDAVYREKNLTRAAEALGMTPPGVSAALRRLRTEFEDELFIRKAHGVEPTVRAESIADSFRVALDMVAKAKSPGDAFNPRTLSRTFVVGMSDYSEVMILPFVLGKLRDEAPNLSLAIRHTGNMPARRSLDEGTFDLIVGNLLTPLGRIRQQQLFTDTFCAIVDSRHPLSGKNFDCKEINNYPALLTEAHGNVRWWEHSSIQGLGYAPERIVTLPGFLRVPELLVGTPFVCISTKRLFSFFAKQKYPVSEIAVPFADQTILMRQYWHERHHGDPAHKWLRKLIYTTCQELYPGS